MLDQEEVLGRGRDERRGAPDELRGGRHPRELQRGEGVDPDVADDVAARRRGVEPHVGVGHGVVPVRQPLARRHRVGGEHAGHGGTVHVRCDARSRIPRRRDHRRRARRRHPSPHVTRAPPLPRRRRAGRARLPRPRRGHRAHRRPDRRGRRERRPAHRVPGDLVAGLPVVHLARRAGLGPPVLPPLPRQLAGVRHPGGREARGGRPRARDHGGDGAVRAARRQPLHRAVDHRTGRRDDRQASQAQAHPRRADGVRRGRRQRPLGLPDPPRPHGRPLLLGAPAAAVEIRHVRPGRAGAHRGLAELLALPRAAPTRSARRSTPPPAGSTRSRAAASWSPRAPPSHRR